MSDCGKTKAELLAELASAKKALEFLKRRFNLTSIEHHKSPAESFDEPCFQDCSSDQGLIAPENTRIALELSEMRFRNLFESTQDLMFIKDSNLCYTEINSAMLRRFGFAKAGVINRTDADLFGMDCYARTLKLERKVLSDQVVENEQTLRFCGHNYIFNFLRFPMRNVAGNVTGLYGIARDLTERVHRKKLISIVPSHYPSQAMNEALNQTQLAASSESLVLFLGESGSGKDFMARYLHEHSARANGPFFSINCAALPEDLVESELFGHERGAFTGAGVRKRGLVELAEGGTLLLNEIGELPARLQAKLLSFLDTQSFIRVGGEKEIFVDCRIVAATNRDLQKEFEMGNFRQDLFYRLNVFSITVPPLRDRLDDLELLVHELYDAICTKMACTCLPQVEHQFIERLKNYSWPGNIRELRNVLERALILSPDYFMSADLIDNALNLGTTIPIKPGSSNDNGIPYNEAVANLKKKLILNALEKSSGNIKRASEILQITRDSLIHQMKSVGLRK